MTPPIFRIDTPPPVRHNDGMTTDLQEINLAFGAHDSREQGMCLMEAVAFLAGEPHTDRPQCVCPALAAFGRAWNDGLPDEDRNRLLKPFIRRLINTRSTPEVKQRRAYMAADWTVRVAAPVWLRAAGLVGEAGSLEALAPLASADACRDAVPTIRRVREAVLAAGDAGVYAARTAARAAAVLAARAAAVHAPVAAAADAAVDTAVYAAGAVARDATATAAVDAGVFAAREALRPHVERLQASAGALFARMIEVRS